jgi:hypothetical protein
MREGGEGFTSGVVDVAEIRILRERMVSFGLKISLWGGWSISCWVESDLL